MRIKTRAELPWLYYPESDSVRIINAHNFGGSWTPADITTALWLDAADSATLFDATSGGSLVAVDGFVARWEDKSGNGRNVTQSTSSKRPSRASSVQNGQDALRFGGDDRLVRDSFIIPQPFTTVIVACVDSLDSDAAVFLDSYNSVQNAIYRGGGGDKNGLFAFNAGSAIAKDIATANTQFNVLGSILSGTSSHWHFNGTKGIVIDAGTNSLSGISVGDLRGNSNPFIGGYSLTGWVAEIIIIPGIADDDRQLAEGYTAHKWGLTTKLPVDHPYKVVAP